MREEHLSDSKEIAASQFIKEKEYWLEKFSGELALTHFPYDYTQKEPGTGENLENLTGNVTYVIDGELFTHIKKMVKDSYPKLHMVLMAGLVTLLYKYTGSRDIIIGTPIDKQDIEGEFTNTVLALRNQLTDNMTFKDLLLQVRQTIINAIENQNYPIEALVKQLGMDFSAAGFPLFDTALLLENIHDRLYLQHVNPNVVFSFLEIEQRIHAKVEYNTALFDKTTIERINTQLARVLMVSLTNPGQPLQNIDILSKEEKQQLIIDFNNTTAPYPKDKPVYRLFEEQAGKTPNNTAVVFEEKEITYAELDEKKNHLAKTLRKNGITTDRIVGILLEKSIELVAAVLGILKAGAAYLPVDIEYPQERKKYILEDSGADLLFAQNTRAEQLEWKGQVMDIEPLSADQVGEEDPVGLPLEDIAKPHHLAYIIYTSGSTGRPKGVMIEHRGLTNYVCWAAKRYVNSATHPGPAAFPLYTSISFDLTVTSLFTPLITGNPIVIYGESRELLVERIIEEDKINVMKLTPTHLRLIRDKTVPHSNIRCLIVGGEDFEIKLANDIYKNFGENIDIYNEYGPTEAAVGCMIYKFNPKTDHWRSVPIGSPADNVQIYILDKNMKPVPPGVSGEIHIAGDGVARGYLNRPQLTAEKFLTIFNRSYMSHTSYIYRTGDLARWLPNGNIEFLGRQDQQIKIRGNRIELGEIENQLSQHQQIKEAVVITRTNDSGESHLCAYVVLYSPLGLSEIMEYLSQKLPDYMIPSYVVSLESLPLNIHGKIDRKALPDPEGISIEDQVEFIPPGNPAEKKLSEVWEKVLGRKNIGINDNFFLIGGDSIRSIQIIARMNNEGYKLDMRDLFQNPTIAALAPLVEKAERKADQSPVTGTVLLTPVQAAFFRENRTSPHHFNMAVMLYEKEGFDEEAVRQVFTKLQEHHDALRITFKKEEGIIRQIDHGLEYPLSLSIYDLRNQENAAKSLEVTAGEIQASINLETGPLMKLGLFHLDDGDRLLIVFHHLVIDGVSWRILFEDIANLMQQYKNGEPLSLPPKTDSFKLWAEKLKEYADSPTFLKEKNHWARLETTTIPRIEKDFPGDNYLKDTDTVSFALSEEKTRQLLTEANAAFGTEINHILLTGLALGIKKTWGHDCTAISLESHGRERIIEDIDISRTVGYFTSVYPILLDASYENHLERQVKEIKETLRQISNRGIGYGILRYLTSELHKKEIDFKLNPQVSFNYLGQFDADVQQGALEIAKESPGSHQDLTEKRNHELEISGIISNKQLIMNIVYSKNHFKAETVKTLMNHFQSELSRVIEFCAAREQRELTPSDFTYTGLSIETVDRLCQQFAHQVQDIYPLTPMQEGMLFHALYDSSSAAYFEQTSYRLHGEINLELMKKSLNELFSRHDILRTAFIHEDIDCPVQVVLKERQVDFYYEDPRELSRKERKDIEAYIERFKQKDRERYFDLSKDVLMRISVLQSDQSEYELIWSFHHVLMDGWCVGILNAEFFEIYNSLLGRRPHRLPPVIPYRNYIHWLQKQDRERAREYWRQYLDAYDEVAAVPKMKMPDAGPAEEYKRTELIFDLEKEKNHRLHLIAAKNHVTLNIVFQAIWGIILGKYNGKTDVVFGAVVSGRPFELEGVENIVGLFINAIPVRISFDQKTKFRELVRILQENAIDSELYHYYPLAEIQAESPLKQQLIDHLFIFENYPVVHQIEQIEEYGEKSEEADKTNTENKELKLRLSNIEVFEQTNYNFNLEMGLAGDQLGVRFLFNSNVYHPAFVERIASHFKQVMAQVIDNEEVELARITLLSGKEKKQILFEFNNTKTTIARDKTYFQLFADQVSQNPDRIAATFLRQHITYRHLNDTANRIADYLTEHGVTPASLVPLFLRRSILMLTSIIGVFKAGAAYLPLEIDYPGTRVQFILEDSAASIVLTESPHLDVLQPIQDSLPRMPDIFCLDPGAPPLCRKNGVEPPPRGRLHTDNLAYMIYTSGTTGKPKGVMVHQLGMINHLYAKINGLTITAGDRIAQTASACFDISVWQFLSGILVGGAVSIIDKETVLEPGRFLRVLQQEKVTILESVPSLMIAFLETIASETGKELPYLRWMVPTGEALTVPLVREWFRHYPGIPLVNAYGPTEASDDVTHYFIKDTPPEDQRSIPIGKPLPNLHIYILDENLSLCPIGVRGEICVAGIGVGKGYWQDTAKTREAFVPNPFREEIGDDDYATIYRTGDIGYMREDGNIECLGRMDFQVKIRGNRIELGEIENRLLQHRDIKETAVTVVPGIGTGFDDKEGYKCLCAYYVSEQEIEATVLREYLSKELPDYMVPSYFVWLGKIPLTPNGKVDRQALPQPQPGEAGDKYIAPRDPLENTLASIWSEVLGIEKDKISIDADFFQLGGHSLKATRLISRIHRELNVRVPIAELFRIPTINKLAACIRKAEKEELLLIVPGEKKEYYPLTSAQTRLYLIQQMQKDTIAYNINDVFVSPVLLDKDRLKEIFAKLIQRHETLRTSIREVSGEPVQEIHKTVDFHVEYYEVNQLGEEAETVMKNFQRPFDLSRAPLLRVGIIKAHQRHVLMVDMHHIISDGVSQEVLAQDFTALYSGEPLPELKIHYKDFSQCQKQMVESGEMKRQEAFWLKEFAVEIPDVVIPADYPRPEFLTFAGDSVLFDISAEETERLRELANQEGATMFMMLLAIYNVLLSKLSGKEDIIVGTGTAGRRHADLERAIGMFVNTIALRNYPFPGITFRDFVKEVRKRTLQAFENQDYLLEDLVEKVASHREMNRSPLFDTALVMENIRMPAQTTQTTQTTDQANEPVAPPLALNRYEFERKTAIFDITIYCVEIEDKLGFNVNYRTALFKKETIEMYINYFKEIAAIVMADMDIKIEDIRFSSDLGDITVDILEKDQGDFGF